MSEDPFRQGQESRLYRLAKRGVWKWFNHPDYEDLLQEALIMAWKMQDHPDFHIVRKCRFLCIDLMRKWNGDRRFQQPIHVSLEDLGYELSGGFPLPEDLLDPSFSWNLSGRLKVVADALLNGETKRMAAKVIGRDAAVVSRICGELRLISGRNEAA